MNGQQDSMAMDLFFADDAVQKRPSRPGMGPLWGVAGVHVPAESIKDLERRLDAVCVEFGFPEGEEFKWSPGKKLWMRTELVEERREQFFVRCLNIAQEAECTAIAIIADERHKPATSPDVTPQRDVVTMFLERAHHFLGRTRRHAVIVADQPGGGRDADLNFLADCIETVKRGTQWVVPERIALILTTDSRVSRLVQLADLVASSTVARVSGEDRFSPRIFEEILPLLDRSGDRVGGVGLKVHADFRYANLYHWLAGDSTFWKGNSGWPLPDPALPYGSDPMVQ